MKKIILLAVLIIHLLKMDLLAQKSSKILCTDIHVTVANTVNLNLGNHEGDGITKYLSSPLHYITFLISADDKKNPQKIKIITQGSSVSENKVNIETAWIIENGNSKETVASIDPNRIFIFTGSMYIHVQANSITVKKSAKLGSRNFQQKLSIQIL
jgi:hypothetical protein